MVFGKRKRSKRILTVLAVLFLAYHEKLGARAVSNKWQNRLARLLEEKNTLHSTAAALREALSATPRQYGECILEKQETTPILTAKTAKTSSKEPEKQETSKKPAAKTAKSTTEAERLGLVATWSIEFGYVSLLDPTTGEWHDLLTKEAPSWAKWEAVKRKALYKSGNRRAYRLTSCEMSKIWEAEHVQGGEGIVENHPLEEEERDQV